MRSLSRIVAVVCLLACPLTLHAQMTESKARTEARRLWGPMGMAFNAPIPKSTSWKYYVGVLSPGCNTPFTIFGEATGSFDAAFTAAAAKPSPILGPYSGGVELISMAWDDVGVVGFQWIIDGTPLGPEVVKTPAAPRINVNIDWNTATGPQGFHVLCMVARDAANNRSASRAVLVFLDQTKPRVSGRIEILNKTADGEPSLQR